MFPVVNSKCRYELFKTVPNMTDKLTIIKNRKLKNEFRSRSFSVSFFFNSLKLASGIINMPVSSFKTLNNAINNPLLSDETLSAINGWIINCSTIVGKAYATKLYRKSLIIFVCSFITFRSVFKLLQTLSINWAEVQIHTYCHQQHRISNLCIIKKKKCYHNKINNSASFFVKC